jgi:signal transduction histidine kinase
MALRRIPPRALDALVALVAFALTFVLVGVGGTGDSTRDLDALGVLLAAGASLPLLARRRNSLAVFAVTVCASATLNAVGYAVGPPFGPTIALFFVASDARTRIHLLRTAAAVAGLFAVHVSSTLLAHGGFPTSPVLFGVLVWGGAWVLGDVVLRRRQRQVAEERDSQRERRLAAAEERTRIARDLHDSAAHAINVILVQAGAARLLQERDPEAVRAALLTIEEVARETIGEIDVLVRGLREDRAAVEPPTGLAALDTLVERHRVSGLAVDVHVDGSSRALPRGLDQAAYRILQESLTNAARHGRGGADVTIRHAGDVLELTVVNPAPLSAPAGRGHGILGMHERAALLGGSLEACRDGDRFRVHARLPLPT